MARIMKGTVVSDAADKTIVVRVDTRKSHPLYHKQYTVSKRYQSHDQENVAKIGDIVEITEGRPRSKTKRWEMTKILEKANS
ncbi:30S ribosomal protein S17 [Candidatus Saccharibacteria bacterium]|jgi:small subunit ribosomal protein S17|nr:30S ribosomal protein S17 [Candidatus Saccharibacteria bacterium]